MKEALLFVAGLAIGGVSTWYFTKTYYKRIADEEIESVKEEFLDKKKKEETKAEDRVKIPADSIVSGRKQYRNIVADAGYTGAKADNSDIREGTPGIVLVSPDECGEDPNYGYDTLLYYADGVLALERNDEIIKNPDKVVSNLALQSFGKWEKDAIAVRNDNDYMYYDIIKDGRTYEEAVGIAPDEMEV